MMYILTDRLVDCNERTVINVQKLTLLGTIIYLLGTSYV